MTAAANISSALSFETPRLAAAIEQLPHETVHNLPFGAIQLDENGKVVFFSDAERRLSGYVEEALHRNFFSEIAPCMNNPSFKGRIDRALAAGTLDVAFDHIGDFDDQSKALRVRVQPATGGGCWIFMRRED